MSPISILSTRIHIRERSSAVVFSVPCPLEGYRPDVLRTNGGILRMDSSSCTSRGQHFHLPFDQVWTTSDDYLTYLRLPWLPFAATASLYAPLRSPLAGATCFPQRFHRMFLVALKKRFSLPCRCACPLAWYIFCSPSRRPFNEFSGTPPSYIVDLRLLCLPANAAVSVDWVSSFCNPDPFYDEGLHALLLAKRFLIHCFFHFPWYLPRLLESCYACGFLGFWYRRFFSIRYTLVKPPAWFTT